MFKSRAVFKFQKEQLDNPQDSTKVLPSTVFPSVLTNEALVTETWQY